MKDSIAAENLTWHVMPQDQGQIVELAYASDPEHDRYLCRTRDRSLMPGTGDRYDALPYDEAEAEGEFEPWNGALPAGTWVTLSESV